MQQLLVVFEQLYSVQVDTVAIPFDQTLDQLSQYGNVGILPDVMQLTGNWSRALAEHGWLSDLTPRIAGIPDFLQDAFPGSLEMGAVGDKIYELPFTVAPLGLWYHKVSLRMAGIPAPATTIVELNDQLATLKKHKLSDSALPIRIDFLGSEYSLTNFWPWIWSFGGNPLEYDQQGQALLNWTDEGTIAAFQWAQHLVDNGYALETPTGWWDRALFAHGRFAYKVDGPYLRGHLSGLNPQLRSVSAINEAFGVAPIPKGSGMTSSVTVTDDHSLAMSAECNDPDLAWTLMRFLTTNDESIRTFLGPQGGLLPVRSHNDLKRYRKWYGDAISQAFLHDIVPTARNLPLGPRYSEAAVKIALALKDVALTPGTNVVDRLVTLQGELEALFATG